MEGGGRERGEGGGHHCSPRRALCRRRRLGGWGSVGRRGRGALRGAARRCFVSSSPSGEARAAGEAPAPSGRPANGGGGASPRPCWEGKRRRGLPGRRGEQVRARAAEAGGRESGGRGDKASPSRVPPLPPHPRPAPVLFAPGFAEGFPEAVAVTTARSWGRGLSAPGQRSGSGSWRKGPARCAPARGEHRARGRAEGRGYGPRRRGGGWAERSWSRCVYISARVTSAEKRTELTRLIPRGGQGGGPAPEEARPGRVGEGGRLRPAPGQGREIGAGPGRLGPLGAAWRTETSFLPRPALSPPLTFPSLRG